jgi:hypothetical protein
MDFKRSDKAGRILLQNQFTGSIRIGNKYINKKNISILFGIKVKIAQNKNSKN